MSNQFFYESPINKALEEKIKKLLMDHEVIKHEMESVEAAGILALYIKRALEFGLRHYTKDNELQKQLDITNNLINEIGRLTEDNAIEEWLLTEGQILKAIAKKPINKKLLSDKIPQTSMSKSSLFTGSQSEPQVYRELKREIATADEVDVLVSFIKFSGLRLIYDDLVEHTKTKPLRIITTSYMGATDAKAIEMLAELPNTEVKISYDTNRTRLHAKAYYFHRGTGFSTAYIGSSNMSKAALSEGTEWNLKVSEYTSPEIIAKFKITFETYWHMTEFETFHPGSEEDQTKLQAALNAEKHISDDQMMYFDLRPFAYQQEIIEQLEIERKVYSSYRNLVVAATGTGKTMIAAFDFLNYYREFPHAKLLFLAHRQEILKQSCITYRAVLKDQNFGEYWVAGRSPERYDHVFASIQTLNADRKYLNLPKDHFDVIVLDETHHSASNSYQRIIDHFSPKILLGLTATPERMDGQSILEDFNNRVASEIRLNQAIDQNLLCPFHYFGISDDTDLSHVKWQSGKYVSRDLSAKFIGDYARDRAIVSAAFKYISDLKKVKGLGFCVDQDHAKHMSSVFNKVGIKSASLDANSPKDFRHSIQDKLRNGELQFIFVVDLYNEGVDLPYVNTILFLRPTESATVFIQQLGRGLRLYQDKEVLTVLDFIGQAHKNYNYRMKFQKLVGKTRHSVHTEVEMDFPSVPRNCFVQLEKLAKEYVLRNLKQGQTDIRKLRQMYLAFKTDAQLPLTLKNFLTYYDLTSKELYNTACLFELENEINMITLKCPLLENVKFKDVFYKFAQIDDMSWIDFMIGYLKSPLEFPFEKLTLAEQRQLLMMYYTMMNEEPNMPLEQFFQQLKTEAESFTVELMDLLSFNLDNIRHIPKMIELPDIPLELHANYSTAQVLAAFGVSTIEKRMPFREGVKYVDEYNTDVFFITLRKSEKHFTETTLYEDYAIDANLFHWQSQSRTTLSSPTGQRYVNQRSNRSKVILFAREARNDENNKTDVFTCLGLADYNSHQGSAPISIIYKLRHKMPTQLMRASNRFVNIG